MKIKFVSPEAFNECFVLCDEEREAAVDFISFASDCEDAEVACSYSYGCFIFRYRSDEAGYYFSAPYPLTEKAEVASAYKAISDYCRLEAIRETIVDIPEDELELAKRGAEHYDIDSDEDGMCMLSIYNECMLIDEIPEVMIDDVYLGEFAMSYAFDYEKMLKNENLNLHYGYNLLEDIPGATGKDMIENARKEFENGESITLAATVLSESGENVFVGEGTIYGFDGRGAAYSAFRVLPEWQGRGIGKKIFRGLLKISGEIGLKKLLAEVKKENQASLALMNSFGAPEYFDEKKYSYSFAIE